MKVLACENWSGVCENPHWWHFEHDSETEIEVSEFLGTLIRLIQPEVVVESGTLYGQTTEQIGLALKQNGHGRLWAVEPKGRFYESTRNRVAGLPVSCMLSTIEEFLPPTPINFLFLDSTGDQFSQFEHLFPFFAPGAVLALHDTQLPGSEAQKALVNIKGKYGHLFEGVEFQTPHGLWIGRFK